MKKKIALIVVIVVLTTLVVVAGSCNKRRFSAICDDNVLAQSLSPTKKWCLCDLSTEECRREARCADWDCATGGLKIKDLAAPPQPDLIVMRDLVSVPRDSFIGDMAVSSFGCWQLWNDIENLGGDIGAIVRRYQLQLLYVSGKVAPADSLQIHDAAMACLERCGCSAVETTVNGVSYTVHADCGAVRWSKGDAGVEACIERCLDACKKN